MNPFVNNSNSFFFKKSPYFSKKWTRIPFYCKTLTTTWFIYCINNH